MFQDKRKLYHKGVQVLCLATAIAGLCWIFGISNIKREETVSVSGTYNIGTAINELEWKELGEEELYRKYESFYILEYRRNFPVLF